METVKVFSNSGSGRSELMIGGAMVLAAPCEGFGAD